MTRDDWRKVEEIMCGASERRSPLERRHFLDRACHGDDRLRREVERLLAAEEEAPGFLEKPVCRIAAPHDEVGEERRIGPYRLLRELGEGGMGTVYLAIHEDAVYRRQVALKLVRGDLVRGEVLRRFRNERRILAAFEHPSIARLYDGGTAGDGRPYLVMEYVDGQPITEFCRRRRSSVDERLELFLKVCDAVDYAHQHLLVHRDLKPSNILVTRGGAPKLLDFGIAKLLGCDAGLAELTAIETATTQRHLTPAYASPEQICGDPVTTRSDVYSLGVLLYELLSGRSPYPSKRVREIERAIFVGALEKPSRAAESSRHDGGVPAGSGRRIAGDLDLIVMKALRKEPERRYSSVERLAQDVERHRRKLPVRARPDSWVYRAERFCVRHRAGVVSALFVLLLSGGFLSLLARQSGRLETERHRSREVVRELTGLLGADPEQTTARHSAREVLAAVVPRLRAEARGTATLAVLLDALGQVYHQAGLDHAARDLMEESLDLRASTSDVTPRDLAAGLHNLGAVTTSLGEVERGQALLSEALLLRQRLWGEQSAGVAETKEALALARWSEGDFAGAEALLLDAVKTRDHVCRAESNYWVTESLSHLAALYARSGRLAQGEVAAREARERRRAFGDHPEDRARSLDDRAGLHFARGEYAAAEGLYRDSLQIRRALVAKRASAGENGLDGVHAVARSLHHVARSLGERGAYEEAERYFSESLAMTRRLREGPSPEAATLMNNLAAVLSYKGEHVAAEALFERALDMRLELFGEGHPHVAQVRYSLGRLFHDRGDLARAEELYKEAVSGLRIPETHPAWAYPRVAQAHLLLDRDEVSSAETALRDALSRLRKSHDSGHWRIAEAESLLGESLRAQKRFAEAEELLRRGYMVLQEQRSARSPRTRQALRRLADFYRAQEEEGPFSADLFPEMKVQQRGGEIQASATSAPVKAIVSGS